MLHTNFLHKNNLYIFFLPRFIHSYCVTKEKKIREENELKTEVDDHCIL